MRPVDVLHLGNVGFSLHNYPMAIGQGCMRDFRRPFAIVGLLGLVLALGWFVYRANHLRALRDSLALAEHLGRPARSADLWSPSLAEDLVRHRHISTILVDTPIPPAFVDSEMWPREPSDPGNATEWGVYAAALSTGRTWELTLRAQLGSEGHLIPFFAEQIAFDRGTGSPWITDSPERKQHYRAAQRAWQRQDLLRLWMRVGDIAAGKTALHDLAVRPGGMGYIDHTRLTAARNRFARALAGGILSGVLVSTADGNDLIDAWLAQPFDVHPLVLESLTSERLIYLNEFAKHQGNLSDALREATRVVAACGPASFGDHVRITADLAEHLRRQIWIEHHLATGGTPTEISLADIDSRSCNVLFMWMVPDIVDLVEYHLRLHTWRVALRILRTAPATEDLPRDQHELMTLLGPDVLRTEADLPNLAYTLMSNGVFHIGPDVSTSTWLLPAAKQGYSPANVLAIHAERAEVIIDVARARHEEVERQRAFRAQLDSETLSALAPWTVP